MRFPAWRNDLASGRWRGQPAAWPRPKLVSSHRPTEPGPGRCARRLGPGDGPSRPARGTATARRVARRSQDGARTEAGPLLRIAPPFQRPTGFCIRRNSITIPSVRNIASTMIWLDEGGRQRDSGLIAPPPSLCGAVEHFWIHQRLPRRRWRVVPDLSAHVIFSLAGSTAVCRIVGAREDPSAISTSRVAT